MENYTLGEVIGQGSYSVVYRGVDLRTGQNIAIKKIHNFEDNGVPKTTIREISLLKELQHDNIVKLFDVVSIGKEWYLILEYLHLDLKKFIVLFPQAMQDGQVIKRLLSQILSGVAYCHSHAIMHRDLKPSNLLVDAINVVVKLADFGLARVFHIPLRAYSPEVVTLWYRPPEILLGMEDYSTAIDVWSVGCIFGEMITGKPMFPGYSKKLQLHHIFSVLGTPNEEMWPAVSSLPHFSPDFPQWDPQNLAEVFKGFESAGVDLLSKMLCMDPARRISAHDALEHAYFQNGAI